MQEMFNYCVTMATGARDRAEAHPCDDLSRGMYAGGADVLPSDLRGRWRWEKWLHSGCKYWDWE